jgi:LmbE family N-acetylglucosaminyl deacetylase
MRRALLLALIVLSFAQLDRRRAKAMLRRGVASVCRHLLNWCSDRYAVHSQTAVVFAPHQDDETFGCAGLIARKRNAGLPVHVIFITDGSASHPAHPRVSTTELAALRQQEARCALSVLGVESTAIHFLNEADGTLHRLEIAHRTALVSRIAALLGQLNPDEIFLPCSPDGSSEHDAAFAVVIEAIQNAALRPQIWQYPIWSWWNPLLLLRRLVFSRGYCQLPAEDYHPIKRQAIACYQSQIAPLSPQTEPSLPRELLHLLDGEAEYFFRFNLPEHASVAEPRP